MSENILKFPEFKRQGPPDPVGTVGKMVLQYKIVYIENNIQLGTLNNLARDNWQVVMPLKNDRLLLEKTIWVDE